MPQLNPAPWFKIFLFSWLIFLTIIPYKVLAHRLPNQPTTLNTQTTQKTTWSWPWY
uniref:ATP synthase complex subunit 8 n=1 Tax=Arnoglossus tenuis TaxID=366891 RepID=A0A509Z3F2_9PLEU|nr:ATP synthase F0 subunit 8 [Arnoglossus tenuis]AKA95093.1 ATP synthase subunit 8 [Arnoglossus tenuis]